MLHHRTYSSRATHPREKNMEIILKKEARVSTLGVGGGGGFTGGMMKSSLPMRSKRRTVPVLSA